MKRYLEKYIRKDLKRKIIILTGPRQAGKTTLSKMLDTSFDYFNYDYAERSPNFSFFEKFLAGAKKIQIVKELKREKTYPDAMEIRSAQNWLSEMPLNSV